MSHRVAKIQDWQERALCKHVEATDETERSLIIQEALKEHHVTLLPILADLHILCDMKASRVINTFFSKENEQSKGEATTEINTWRAVQRLVENFVPKEMKGHFHELRRGRIAPKR